MIRMLTPHPALLVENGETVMLAADLHLGMEYDLAKQGINIPYQWSRMLDELVWLLEEHEPDRLVLLGDVKHGVPTTSFQEKQEIPGFFESLLRVVNHIDVTRGNHDANIQQFLPKQVRLHSSKGFTFGESFRVAVMHGHAWPTPEAAAADCLIMAHNHPTVLLNTPLGIKISQRAWVRGVINRVDLAKAFLEQDNVKVESDPVTEFIERYNVNPGCPEIIIIPMFNDLLGGLPVNAEAPKSLLGPLFRTGAVDLECLDVYLLDGTYIGKVSFLRQRLESSV